MATKSINRTSTGASHHQPYDGYEAAGGALNKSKINNGGIREATHANEDSDNVDLKNYKGIYANEDNNQKY